MNNKLSIFVAILSLIIGIFVTYFYFNSSKEVKYRYTFQLSYSDVRSLYNNNTTSLNQLTNEFVRICPFRRSQLDMIVKYTENLMPKIIFKDMLAVDIDRADDCTTYNFILVSINNDPNLYIKYYNSDTFKNRLINVSHIKLNQNKISVALTSSESKYLSQSAIIFNSISLLLFTILSIFFIYFLLIKLYYFISKLIKT